MKVETLAREFHFNGVRLPDPNANMSLEEVRSLYSATYPDIATASVSGPEVVGNKLRYSFERAIGSKG